MYSLTADDKRITACLQHVLVRVYFLYIYVKYQPSEIAMLIRAIFNDHSSQFKEDLSGTSKDPEMTEFEHVNNLSSML